MIPYDLDALSRGVGCSWGLPLLLPNPQSVRVIRGTVSLGVRVISRIRTTNSFAFEARSEDEKDMKFAY